MIDEIPRNVHRRTVDEESREYHLLFATRRNEKASRKFPRLANNSRVAVLVVEAFQSPR